MNNASNTQQGINAEHLFANSIFDHPNAWHGILESIGLSDMKQVTCTTSLIGGFKRKTDVDIEAEGCRQVRVTVKSFRVGYIHLQRCNLLDFCNRNQITASDTDFLKKIWLRKAHKAGKGASKGQLVRWDEMARVKAIFETIEPAVSSVLGNDHPQILAIYNIERRRFNLYDITKQILPLIRNQQIHRTNRGGNIGIGDYIVIQRKGSTAKGEAGRDIYSMKHGSNHILMKLNAKKLFDRAEPASWYQL